jgi:hypothetical protein
MHIAQHTLRFTPNLLRMVVGNQRQASEGTVKAWLRYASLSLSAFLLFSLSLSPPRPPLCLPYSTNTRRRENLSWLRVLTPVLTQQYDGDITIVPRPRLSDYLSPVSNLSWPDIKQRIDDGERNVWPHLAEIEMSCRIEVTLDECVKSVRGQLHQANAGRASPVAGGRSRSRNGGLTLEKTRIKSYQTLPKVGSFIGMSMSAQ